ncbi:MAG: TonB-dependent receptor [Hyphomonas sp.]|jgi:iron complex outermembrane receptor protein|uniref:TonB-dependent receptor plug domain-containing protein n=1 Tax=Hyphomonas sp. TaxID=87 RepID=UPI0032678439
MKRILSAGTALIALATCPLLAAAETPDPALQDVIIVTGHRTTTATDAALLPEAAPMDGMDITRLIARTPGAARIGNGEMSGQMQYRGLFGPRLNLRIDGHSFASGGPNLMDPALHYAPTPLVAAVHIDRGISPVSEGPGIGGGADAIFKRTDYSNSSEATLGYDLTIGGRTVNDSLSTGGIIGASTDTWRANLLGAYEEGGDTAYKDGTIGGSEFQRSIQGLSTGLRTDLGEFSLDWRRHNTGFSGNPPFGMDIRFVDTDVVKAGYEKSFGDVRVEASASYTDAAHGMNTYDLRPAMMRREALAYAITRKADISATFPAFGGSLQLGADTAEEDHNVSVVEPENLDNYVYSLPDIVIDRYGAFAEWTGTLGVFNAELGLRVDEYDGRGGTATFGEDASMGQKMLAASYNASDRSTDATTVDAAARLWRPITDDLTWRVTLARKSRAPFYLEWFQWLPSGSSAGLADGNIYLGDPSLDPEVALIAETGFDYVTDTAYIRPTVYIRQIDDFIQGTPFDDTPGAADSLEEMMASMHGSSAALLRFTNVDARLIGFDLDAGMDLPGPLRADAVLSYVRGERRDLDEDLYRIAPPSLTAGLTWEGQDWSATFETRAVAEQDKVSQTLQEAGTPGHVMLSLYGDWQVKDGVRLSAGVENLLDQITRDHLSGYNRNAYGDVAIGTRLPGAGRGAFIRLSFVG